MGVLCGSMIANASGQTFRRSERRKRTKKKKESTPHLEQNWDTERDRKTPILCACGCVCRLNRVSVKCVWVCEKERGQSVCAFCPWFPKRVLDGLKLRVPEIRPATLASAIAPFRTRWSAASTVKAPHRSPLQCSYFIPSCCSSCYLWECFHWSVTRQKWSKATVVGGFSPEKRGERKDNVCADCFVTSKRIFVLSRTSECVWVCWSRWVFACVYVLGYPFKRSSLIKRPRALVVGTVWVRVCVWRYIHAGIFFVSRKLCV